MQAEILSIGTELLVGSILNTNTRFLSERLAGQGVDVYRHVTVGDNRKRLAEALETALSRSDLVICSGGLGPTADDITMEMAAHALGVERFFCRETARHIRERLKSAGFRVSKLSLNQCLLPKGAVVFQNDNGTAPGLLCETVRGGERKLLALLPGPPSELEPLFERQLWPEIRRRLGGREAFYVSTSKIAELPETAVAEKVGDLLSRRPPLTCGIYASAGEVHLKIMAKAATERAARRLAAPAEKSLRRIFGSRIFGWDQDTFESVALASLQKRRATLAVAESCTGGLVSHLLTEVPGSSGVFRGTVIAYSNSVKERLLGVPAGILNKHGAVSAPVAAAMAQGIRRALGASLGLALTGIAGPSGGTAQKPVGLVFIGLSDSGGTRVHRFRFAGKRSAIKLKAAKSALNLIRLRLSSPRGNSTAK